MTRSCQGSRCMPSTWNVGPEPATKRSPPFAIGDARDLEDDQALQFVCLLRLPILL